MEEWNGVAKMLRARRCKQCDHLQMTSCNRCNRRDRSWIPKIAGFLRAASKVARNWSFIDLTARPSPSMSLSSSQEIRLAVHLWDLCCDVAWKCEELSMTLIDSVRYLSFVLGPKRQPVLLAQGLGGRRRTLSVIVRPAEGRAQKYSTGRVSLS